MDYLKAIADLLVEKTCGIEQKETEYITVECDCTPVVYTALLAGTSVLLLNLFFITLNRLPTKPVDIDQNIYRALTPEELVNDLDAESESESSGSESEPEPDFVDIKL